MTPIDPIYDTIFDQHSVDTFTCIKKIEALEISKNEHQIILQ